MTEVDHTGETGVTENGQIGTPGIGLSAARRRSPKGRSQAWRFRSFPVTPVSPV